jgi:hypothetical protein
VCCCHLRLLPLLLLPLLLMITNDKQPARKEEQQAVRSGGVRKDIGKGFWHKTAQSGQPPAAIT